MLTYAGVVSFREVAARGAAAQVYMLTKTLQLTKRLLPLTKPKPKPLPLTKPLLPLTKPLLLTKPLMPLTKRQLEVLLRRYISICLSSSWLADVLELAWPVL